MKIPTGKTSRFGRPVAATLLVAGYLASASGAASATNEASPPVAQLTCQHTDKKPTTRIAAAKLFIEYNSTDDDTGIHGAFDDAGWSRLCVFDPDGNQVLAVNPQSQLKDLTMGGIFFESREPPRSEFTFAELRAEFPAGRYTVRGTTFEGEQLVGSAIFTHNVPAAPVITSPPLTPEGTLPTEGLVVSWEPVTQTVDGRPVTITGYEVIVTKEVPDDPNGFSRPTYDVHVPADVTSLSVPAEFLEPGTEYELEVLALEVSGNQTITVGFFTTD